MIYISEKFWPAYKDTYGYYIDTSNFKEVDHQWKGQIISNIEYVYSQLNIHINMSLFTEVHSEVLVIIYKTISELLLSENNSVKLFMNIIDTTSIMEWREGWEYYTPSSISKIIEALIDTKNTKSVYDPTMWIGSLLQSIKHICPKSKIYGQEINATTFLYAQLYSIVSDSFLDTHIALWDTLTDPQHINQKFDLIVSNSPIWLKIDYHKIAHRFDIVSKSGDIAFIQHALSQLSDEWTYIAVVPNGLLFRWGEEKRYREELLKSWIIHCVIGLPSGLFSSTQIPFSVIIFDKRNKSENVHIIDATDMFEESKNNQRILSENHINTIVDAYYNSSNINWISKYISTQDIISNNSNLLVSYYIDKFALQFQNITSNFPSYKITTLWDLIESEPVRAKGDEEWWVYFLTNWRIRMTTLYTKEDIIGSISHIDDKSFKNYLHISFKSDIVLNDYFNCFIDSEMWKLSLDELYHRSAWMISMYWYADNISHFKSLKVLYPKISEQKKIVQAYIDLEKVISSIHQIKKDLAVNPTNASHATEQSFKILESLKELTDADKIMDLIRRWEGKNIEFKETLHYNERSNKQKDEDLITASLKNIVAFLNTDWWDLLIGVHDSWEIIGIEKDAKQYQNIDKLLLFIKDKIKSRIWEQFIQYIDYNQIHVNNKNVLWFHCSKSETPCFLDDKSFYIRANPSAEELSWSKQLSYISSHFKK